ncbi:uncharacterized protein EAF02_002368 [Botrytis sinoallii]|uniref:uncharacterized protein n=1 Tax=Botrytis sinoallii TaxID=1463999 RepID=UPI00190187FD|nr:uncharacterized protein EAF02_002368 [Botrytis sinoallii]KAF7889953.1 hypothetical protein EAF02_002368 [Botrytis sinoallii]
MSTRSRESSDSTRIEQSQEYQSQWERVRQWSELQVGRGRSRLVWEGKGGWMDGEERSTETECET